MGTVDLFKDKLSAEKIKRYDNVTHNKDIFDHNLNKISDKFTQFKDPFESYLSGEHIDEINSLEYNKRKHLDNIPEIFYIKNQKEKHPEKFTSLYFLESISNWTAEKGIENDFTNLDQELAELPKPDFSVNSDGLYPGILCEQKNNRTIDKSNRMHTSGEIRVQAVFTFRKVISDRYVHTLKYNKPNVLICRDQFKTDMVKVNNKVLQLLDMINNNKIIKRIEKKLGVFISPSGAFEIIQKTNLLKYFKELDSIIFIHTISTFSPELYYITMINLSLDSNYKISFDMSDIKLYFEEFYNTVIPSAYRDELEHEYIKDNKRLPTIGDDIKRNKYTKNTIGLIFIDHCINYCKFNKSRIHPDDKNLYILDNYSIVINHTSLTMFNSKYNLEFSQKQCDHISKHKHQFSSHTSIAQTGVFFTPTALNEFYTDNYDRKIYTDDELYKSFTKDDCAGQGGLLMYNRHLYTRLYASTLEEYDVNMMIKNGLGTKDNIFKLDKKDSFNITRDINNEPKMITNWYLYPPKYKLDFEQAVKNKEIINVRINPPYGTSVSRNLEFKYGITSGGIFKEMLNDGFKGVSNQIMMLWLYELYLMAKSGIKLRLFLHNKPIFLANEQYKHFRVLWHKYFRYKSGCLISAEEYGASPKWAVSYTIWETKDEIDNSPIPQEYLFDIIEKKKNNKYYVSDQITLFNLDNQIPIKSWVREFVKKDIPTLNRTLSCYNSCKFRSYNDSGTSLDKFSYDYNLNYYNSREIFDIQKRNVEIIDDNYFGHIFSKGVRIEENDQGTGIYPISFGYGPAIVLKNVERSSVYYSIRSMMTGKYHTPWNDKFEYKRPTIHEQDKDRYTRFQVASILLSLCEHQFSMRDIKITAPPTEKESIDMLRNYDKTHKQLLYQIYNQWLPFSISEIDTLINDNKLPRVESNLKKYIDKFGNRNPNILKVLKKYQNVIDHDILLNSFYNTILNYYRESFKYRKDKLHTPFSLECFDAGISQIKHIMPKSTNDTLVSAIKNIENEFRNEIFYFDFLNKC